MKLQKPREIRSSEIFMGDYWLHREGDHLVIMPRVHHSSNKIQQAASIDILDYKRVSLLLEVTKK